MALLTEAVRDADLRSDQIPSIDLYLDQIISIVTDSLKSGSERYADRILTKTMINNYSKDGLIQPVKGKKYTKEQIMQMLLVYTLKNTLSMNEIKRVLSDVYARELPLTGCYDRFVGNKPDDRAHTVQAVEDMITDHQYDMANDEDYLSVLLELCTLSAYYRSIAQALIEAKYPDPDEVERERAQKEKEEERERSRIEKEEEHRRREAERAEKAARTAQRNQEKAAQEAADAAAALAALSAGVRKAKSAKEGAPGESAV